MPRFYVVEGQTEPVDVQLLADDRPLDLTGCATTLVLRDKNGTLIAAPGDVTVLDALTGKVRYRPLVSTFVAALSPYAGRWQIVDATLTVGFWPTRAADTWMIGP